jgi:hypothetical protein
MNATSRLSLSNLATATSHLAFFAALSGAYPPPVGAGIAASGAGDDHANNLTQRSLAVGTGSPPAIATLSGVGYAASQAPTGAEPPLCVPVVTATGELGAANLVAKPVGSIVIEIAGAVVRADPGVDLGWLRDVLRAVQSRPFVQGRWVWGRVACNNISGSDPYFQFALLTIG